MNKKEILNVGQIGCGAFAEGQDFRNLNAHPQVNLKWACDISSERAQTMASKFGVPNVTSNFMDVLNDPEIDMIKISTSHSVHLPIIRAAAERGIHIFCEKPMALDETEAFEIITAVRKNRVKMCVDMNRRVAPAMLALQKQFLAHRAAPRHQPWRYIENGRPRLTEDSFAHLLISIQDEGMSYRMTHLDPRNGGGEIMGEAVHWLDLVCALFAPARPVRITGMGSPRLSHSIRLEFDNGDDALLVFSTVGTFDYPKETYELTCEGALFRSCFFVENQYYGVPGLDKEYFPLQHDCMKERIASDGIDAYMQKAALRVQGLRNSKEGYGDLTVDKGHYNMLDFFVCSILEDSPSPCDEIAGYLAVYLARKAIESICLGQTLHLSPADVCPAFT